MLIWSPRPAFLVQNASYGLVFGPESERSGGVLRHLLHGVISDLFERRDSEAVRLRRRAEREKRNGVRKVSVFDPRKERKRAAAISAAVGVALFLYLYQLGPR